MKYFKFNGNPFGLGTCHVLFERIALENREEAVFMGIPEKFVIFGRKVPYGLFDQKRGNLLGVGFNRTFMARQCNLYTDSNSVSIIAAFSADSRTKASLEDSFRNWVSAALDLGGISYKITRFAFVVDGKYVAVCAPAAEESGMFITGGSLFLRRDNLTSKAVLPTQIFYDVDDFAGLNDLGYSFTQAQLIQALEGTFEKNMGSKLVLTSLDTIRAQMLQYYPEHISQAWINEGLL